MTEHEESPFPWGDFTVEFELTAARVVATLGQDRGAIVESVSKLLCWEGRLYSFETRDEDELNSLEYRFGFSEREDADPLASSSVEGRIVISGIHSNGLHMEIRGDGWIGYDEKGNLEGTFDAPPVIIVEDHEPSGDAPEKKLVFPEFPMPPQFNRAKMRVGPSGS